MGYLYKRGKKIWIGYTDIDGQEKQVSTGLDVGQERKARKLLDRIEARIEAGEEFNEAELGPVTVKRYSEQWIAGREADGIVTAKDDEARLRLHVHPDIGTSRLEEIKTRHIRALIKKLKRGRKLAPRTIRHVYGTLHKMFADAVADELIDFNPCALNKEDLPKKVDKDPTWRANAVFTRDELAQLLSDDRTPEDRRVLYSLMGLAGLRFGEAAALTWRHYTTDIKPLGQFLVAFSYNTNKGEVKGVKTEQPRQVPVHPTLAKILASWKIGGWQRMMGGPPTADDPIIPSRRGRHRSRHHSLTKFHEDLSRLGQRRRRQHDLRRTFITLARTDGARKDVLESVTHAPRGDIMDQYTTLPWPLLCEEVAKLQVTLIESKVLEFPKASFSGGISQDLPSSEPRLEQKVTYSSTYSGFGNQSNISFLKGKVGMEAPGIEPGSENL